MRLKISLLLGLIVMILASCGHDPVNSEPKTDTASESLQSSHAADSSDRMTENGLPLDKAVQDYLYYMGVNSSAILSIDETKIAKIAYEPAQVSFEDYFDVMDVFDFYYTRRDKDESKEILSGDFALLSLYTEDRARVDSAWILASSDGKTFPSIQKDLIGKKKGDEGEWLVEAGSADISLDSLRWKGNKLQYRIDRVLQLKDGPEEIMALLTRNGFNTPDDLFMHLTITGLKEERAKKRYEARIDYLNKMTECAVFRLESKDIETHVSQLRKNFSDIAASYVITLEQYWNQYRDSIVPRPPEEDMEKYLNRKAEEDIKQTLTVGALAKGKGIDISPEEIEAAVGSSSDVTPGLNRAESAFICLEEKLLCSMNAELEGTRYSGPSANPLEQAAREEWRAVWEAESIALEEERKGKIYRDLLGEQAALLGTINKKLTSLYSRGKQGEASEQERSLVNYLPVAEYDGWCEKDVPKGKIYVRFAVDEADLEKAISLFKDVMGVFEEINYKAEPID